MSIKTSKQSVMTQIWVGLALVALVIAMFQNNLKALNDAIVDSAKLAVGLAIALAGITALWLGLVKIIEKAGFMQRLARWIAPVMRRLFPNIPEGHAALSAMTLSFSANLLGLGNAATPFGLKAMTYLDDLNDKKDTASDSMCLFLAITTSGLAILPTGVISIRMIAGSQNPAGIVIPTILSTATATFVAILSCVVLRRWFRDEGGEGRVTVKKEPSAGSKGKAVGGPSPLIAEQPVVPWRRWLGLSFFAIALGMMIYQAVGWQPADRIGMCLESEGIGANQVKAVLECAGERVSKVPLSCLKGVTNEVDISKGQAACLNDSIMNLLSTTWLIPLLLIWFVLYGWARNVDVYAVMVDGMKEGLQIIFYILPFLLSIFLVMALFRSSGAMELVTSVYEGTMAMLGLSSEWVPAEVLPIALTRPLSGSGASALMMELVNQEPDSLGAFMASVMSGSTDTTFYILAVYFGSVGVVKVRYAVIAGLLADLAGMIAAIVLSHLFYT